LVDALLDLVMRVLQFARGEPGAELLPHRSPPIAFQHEQAVGQDAHRRVNIETVVGKV